MKARIKPLTKRPAWKALTAHYKKARELAPPGSFRG